MIGVRLFLGEENITISNFSMIYAAQFHDNDVDGPNSPDIPSVNLGGADGQNDGVWCQSALNQTMIGSWYLPNGSPVPTAVNATPVQSYNVDITGQVGLLRDGGINQVGYEGLYTCIIPNENGINQTLYVAAYGNGEYQQTG